MISDQTLANAIRVLSMDAVQQAGSGHPGMPMGMADIATVLWRGFLKHNPNNPQWSNRDRFILSNGHGSMLHYACLHLTGYNITIEDLKQFRRLHSKTPGHPEYGLTPGVETTTGPLGQGFAHAVGMALAEKTLAACFNRSDYPIVDHYTYVFLGDGCLMEGISHEVGSLAGTLGLGKLIAFWDDNGVSIDGPVSGWFNDDTPARFEAYGWHVIAGIDGHDHQQLTQAIMAAQRVVAKPSLLCCKTQIGFGAPHLAGKAAAHGAPLGQAEIAATRQQLAWPYLAFVIPSEVYQHWDARETGAQHERTWRDLFNAYQQTYPDLAAEFNRRIRGELPLTWAAISQTVIQQASTQTGAIATRQASQHALNGYGLLLPELLGGSADLTESNATFHKAARLLSQREPAGNYLHYGVREFGMSAMMLGIALHGGFIPYGATFLVFSDYARPALRLAALTKQRVIFVYTHDSIGVGEDGPTHQPIEQLSALRVIPNLVVWRPCDSVETAVAWQQALQRQEGPSCLILSRQALAAQHHTETTRKAIAKGAYVILEPATGPQGIIMATGSEVGLAIEAAKQLQMRGYSIRVVSMPATNCFAAQDLSYQEAILPSTVMARVAIEAGTADFWYRYVGSNGKVIGLDRYGESAPGAEVFKAMGITVERIIAAMQALLLPVPLGESS